MAEITRHDIRAHLLKIASKENKTMASIALEIGCDSRCLGNLLYHNPERESILLRIINYLIEKEVLYYVKS